MNFFSHFLNWCDNVNFVNIEGQEELKNILFTYEEKNKNGRKEPVYKFTPNSEGMPEDVMNLSLFIDKLTEQVRKSNTSSFAEILMSFFSFITSGSTNLGINLLSLGMLFANFILNAIKDERVEEE